MRRIFFSILFILFSISLLNAQELDQKPEFGLKASSVYKNLRYKSFVSEEQINNSPCWNGKGNPLISIGTAVEIATKQLNVILDNTKIIGLEKIELQPLEGFSNACQKWLYFIHFEPKYPKYDGLKQSIVILVLMDGTTIKPETEEIIIPSKQN